VPEQKIAAQFVDPAHKVNSQHPTKCGCPSKKLLRNLLIRHTRYQ